MLQRGLPCRHPARLVEHDTACLHKGEHRRHIHLVQVPAKRLHGECFDSVSSKISVYQVMESPSCHILESFIHPGAVSRPPAGIHIHPRDVLRRAYDEVVAVYRHRCQFDGLYQPPRYGNITSPSVYRVSTGHRAVAEFSFRHIRFTVLAPLKVKSMYPPAHTLSVDPHLAFQHHVLIFLVEYRTLVAGQLYHGRSSCALAVLSVLALGHIHRPVVLALSRQARFLALYRVAQLHGAYPHLPAVGHQVVVPVDFRRVIRPAHTGHRRRVIGLRIRSHHQVVGGHHGLVHRESVHHIPLVQRIPVDTLVQRPPYVVPGRDHGRVLPALVPRMAQTHHVVACLWHAVQRTVHTRQVVERVCLRLAALCHRECHARLRIVGEVYVVVPLPAYLHRLRIHTGAEPPVVLVRHGLAIDHILRLAPRQLAHRPLVLHLPLPVVRQEVAAVAAHRLVFRLVCYLLPGSVTGPHHVHAVAAGREHHRSTHIGHLVYLERRYHHLHPHDQVVYLHRVAPVVLGHAIPGTVQTLRRSLAEVLASQI